MGEALEILKGIAAENSDVQDNYLAGFNQFGASSLGIIFIYYIQKGSDILNTQTVMNLEIKKRFEASSLNMAYPTQTVYTVAG